MPVKRIRDPVHGTIELPLEAVAIVDHPAFQRLRGIKQTGTAHLVYPGANHTRFEHSLGAYHLARLATARLDLGDEGRDVEVAALLHDVGHGPLSHISEPVLERHLHQPHEAFSVALIRGELRDAIQRAGADPDRVAGLVLGKGLLAGLVSGALDVDRLDYTLRDAHYTGVAVAVDVDRLMENLVATKDGVGLRVDALASAEGLLMARFALHGAVYFHHACRAGEVMLQRALEVALDEGALEAKAAVRMDDAELLTRLRTTGGVAADIVGRLLQRKLHKVAYEVRYRDLPPTALKALLETDVRLELERKLRTRGGPEVVVDLPPVTEEPELNAPVLVGDTVAPLTTVSTLVASLARASHDHFQARVYAPASRRDELRGAAMRALSLVHSLDEFDG